MTSPFPGMDPFIEGYGLWGDFHDHLIEAIYLQLADSVPERYIVRTEQRNYIVLAGADEKKAYSFIPDDGVTMPRSPRRLAKESKKAESALALADEEPVVVRAFIEEEFRESFIEIYEADPNVRLVTSIEVLSPTNKRSGPRRDEFIRKRQATMLEGVHLVEIDLLRGGDRMPMLDPWPECPYVFMVARSKNPQNCRVWKGFSLRPLPAIPIPLAKPDADVTINIQPMIAEIYRRSRYGRTIDYTKSIDPSLQPDEAAWLKKRLRGHAAK